MEAITISQRLKAETVDLLFDHFKLKILKFMDVVALVKIKKILRQKKTPWRNTMMVKVRKRVQPKASGEKLNCKSTVTYMNKAFLVLTMPRDHTAS